MSSSKLFGSCLCGAVHFEIEGEISRVSHCHCSRCRKATGTGHATNVILKLTEATWPRGEELIRRYKLPEAKHFATCFCAACGSPLPRIDPERGLAVVPAGSVDGDLPRQPHMHIFWYSRAPWSCPAGELPVFAEYPPAS